MAKALPRPARAGLSTQNLPAPTATPAAQQPSDDSSEPFCRCPECSSADVYYLNLRREHWFVCEACLVTWLVGENLFSSWRDQTEAHWKRNAKRLARYRVVDYT